MEDEIPLLPISGWTIGPIKAYEAVTFRLDFVTNLMQKPEESNQSPQYVLLAPQALELAAALQKAVQKLQSAEFQAVPGQKH